MPKLLPPLSNKHPLRRWRIKLANGEMIEREAQFCTIRDTGVLVLFDFAPEMQGIFVSEKNIVTTLSPHGWLFVEEIADGA